MVHNGLRAVRFSPFCVLEASLTCALHLVNRVGWKWLFGFMAYGEAWKERRRLFQRYFHPSDVKIHQPRELEHTHILLRKLLESPEKFMDHVRL